MNLARTVDALLYFHPLQLIFATFYNMLAIKNGSYY
jgi:hypothetical protein